jgi:hypothetical protein
MQLLLYMVRNTVVTMVGMAADSLNAVLYECEPENCSDATLHSAKT